MHYISMSDSKYEEESSISSEGEPNNDNWHVAAVHHNAGDGAPLPVDGNVADGAV